MKKATLLICAFLLFIGPVVACLNYFYGIDKNGTFGTIDIDYNTFSKNFDIRLNETRMSVLLKRLKTEKKYGLLSDYAVCLLKLGKIKEALQIFEHLNIYYPYDYKIAANLGTAYELNGQVDSALKYIKQDVELNPYDHDSSEWIHLKVLEAKLQLTKSSSYLDNYSVLQLTDAQKHNSKVAGELHEQLEERFPFCPGPDKIMASLFIDMGDITTNTHDLVTARAFYKIAKEYYGGNADTIKDRIHSIDKLLSKYALKEIPVDTSLGDGSSQNKVDYINYHQLIIDNNPDNNVVNWNSFNSDVTSLPFYG